ncbi:hypothetical protein HanRHA438_Chr03g0112651 [Helianthus annuus]|nr:hypothetical protein HanIR_Chr03g0111111 [Helianthus annuus]KAJ0934881.1 hypothetical protein HanRHA438_Chr03g0112651 [Helianthus annuus]
MMVKLFDLFFVLGLFSLRTNIWMQFVYFAMYYKGRVRFDIVK